MYAFAKRQDNDELACFTLNDYGDVSGVNIIIGWSDNSYILKKSFNSFWDWLKHVVDDIEKWVSLE